LTVVQAQGHYEGVRLIVSMPRPYGALRKRLSPASYVDC
jgi:hypothetical protein